jgi:hypothetical protein
MNLKNLLNIFKAEKPQESRVAVRAQARDYWENPFAHTFQGYMPLKADLKIYDMIREALPICDAAVLKRSRLIGDFTLDGMGNDSVQTLLDDFYRNVRVGHVSKGWRSYQNQVIDSVYAKGFFVSEIVADENLTYIDRLNVLRANDFRFRKNKETGRYELCQVLEGAMMPITLDRQDLIKYGAFDLRDGYPQGVSMLASIPFLAGILMRIQTATDNTIWRIGDPTMYAVYTPGDREEPQDAQKAIEGFREQITESMNARRRGGIKDLGFSTGPGGSFVVKILGADAKYFDITVPYRSATEQVIARFSLPPFMYGLSWSTTERMSTQQADMLVSEIENDRKAFDPVIEQHIDMMLIVNGKAGAKWKHEWQPVNLQDEAEQASAHFQNTQARAKEIEYKLFLRDAGFMKNGDILDWLIEIGEIKRETVRRIGREQVLKLVEERYAKYQTERWVKLMAKNE